MVNSIGTHIKVSNFEDSIKFYEALGFTRVFEYGPGKEIKEAYSGVVFEHGGCKLEIADGHRAVKPEVFSSRMENSKISLMVSVDSLSEVIEKCATADIDITVPVRHYYWGTLELVVTDPDGVVLVFICPYSEEEAQKVGADETWAIQPEL